MSVVSVATGDMASVTAVVTWFALPEGQILDETSIRWQMVPYEHATDDAG